MKNRHTKNETVRVKEKDLLPLSALSSPEAELFKTVLRQMVENERMRARNEFLRIVTVFCVVLLLLLCAGIWLSHDILRRTVSARAPEAQVLYGDLPVAPARPAAAALDPEETPAMAGEAGPEPEPEPAISYRSVLTIPTHGNIPLRVPIPQP